MLYNIVSGVTLLDIEEKMEMTRDILNDAIKKKASKETILKISQRLDEYIVKYLDRQTQFSIQLKTNK